MYVKLYNSVTTHNKQVNNGHSLLPLLRALMTAFGHKPTLQLNASKP